MNLVSLNESTLYISVSLVNVEPVVFFSKTGRTPTNKNDRDINDENNCRPILLVVYIAKKDKGPC